MRNYKSTYCKTLYSDKEEACKRPILGINNKEISCYNDKRILDCPWKSNLLKINYKLTDKQQSDGAQNCYKCADLRNQLTNDCVDIARRVSLHDRGQFLLLNILVKFVVQIIGLIRPPLIQNQDLLLDTVKKNPKKKLY